VRLYGKALARQIPDNVTGHQARRMFGLMTSALGNAYATLASYDGLGIASATGLDAGAVEAARQYLDTANGILQDYFPHMPESDELLTAQQLAELRASASTSSVAAKEVDELFLTSWLDELVDSLIEAIGTVGAKVGAAVAKVAGSFIGGWWWAIALGLGGLWAWHRWGHKLVT
jgi:hypothetical protein